MKSILRGAVIAAAAAVVVFLFHGAVPGARQAGSLWAYEEEPVEMVVLMYHSIDSHENRSDRYTITPQALRRDLEYLQKEGYGTVVMADVIGYVMDGTPLPPKPVMLTFDDGFYNNYLNAFPLLQEFEMRAVVSIIGEESDRFSLVDENSEKYASLTWHQIQEMQNSGLVEFQNHSYGLHRMNGGRHGLAKKWGEGKTQYQRSIKADVGKLQDRFHEMFDIRPTTFTYPYGVVTRDGDEVLRELGFQATLDSRGGVFEVTHEESCLWRIPRNNRPAGTCAQEIIEKVMAARLR